MFHGMGAATAATAQRLETNVPAVRQLEVPEVRPRLPCVLAAILQLVGFAMLLSAMGTALALHCHFVTRVAVSACAGHAGDSRQWLRQPVI